MYTPPTPPADKVDVFLTLNVEVPTVPTAYRCFSYYLPDYVGTQKTQYTGARMDIDERHGQVVHHVLLRKCALSTDFWQAYKTNFGGDCLQFLNWREIGMTTSCNTMVYGWALGAQDFQMPDEVGMPLDDVTYILVEVHFNNPNSTYFPDNDTTSVVLETTKTLRKFDAFASIGSDPALLLPPVPHGLEWFEYETTCPGECTIQFPGPVQIFAHMIHMHIWAHEASFSVYRKGVFYQEVFHVEFFEFHNQGIWNIYPELTILPGDDIYFSCGYNTQAATIDIVMGEKTQQEMCIIALYWYPKRAADPNYPLATGLPACGYYNKTHTICGFEMPLPVPQPKSTAERDRLAAAPTGFATIQPATCGPTASASVPILNVVLLGASLFLSLLF